MKKILSCIIVLSFIFLPLHYHHTLASPVNQVEGVFTTTTVKQVQITSKSLMLHTGASTNHRIITTYSKGTILLSSLRLIPPARTADSSRSNRPSFYPPSRSLQRRVKRQQSRPHSFD